MAVIPYDRHYAESDAACGDPFPSFAAYVKEHGRPGVSVLDLGCGQGRDALLFARAGCAVVGIDVSSVGIAQLRAVAEAEGLDLTATVGDMLTYEPQGDYHVVVLDRVLHMLPEASQRTAVLAMACRAVRPGGAVLVADGPSNRALIKAHLVELQWTLFKDSKNRTFARRPLT